MAVKIPWKSLSKGDGFFSKWGPISTKWGTYSAKQVAFFAAVGLVIVAGVVLRSVHYFGQPDAEQSAPVSETAPSPATATPAATEPATPVPTLQPPASEPAPAQQAAPAPETAPAPPAAPAQEPAPTQATAPAPQAEPSGAADEQAGQPELPDSSVILVSRRPVEVLSGPSATASSMYGFPAGRPFRVIGREGGFAHIKDVETGATGWIDETALAAPPRAPEVAAPSPSRPDAVGRTRSTGSAAQSPRQTAPGPETAARPEPVQPRRRPGLFGGDGPFRGLFGGRN